MRYRPEQIAKLIFLSLLLIIPLSAEAGTCSDRGYTVVFVNGVWDTRDQAQDNERALGTALKSEFQGEEIIYRLGYNQTHLAGVGDLVETILPVFDQYDLDTILMQMHADVATRKILLVGHSQGSVYANKIYEYLTTHGVPAEDVAVYAVATPDSYVAGGGTYINYALDTVIYDTLLKQGIRPLPANATLADFFNSPDNGAASGQGHSFINMYLGGFGTRMVREMQNELAGLQAKEGTATDGCFDSPKNDLAHQMAGTVLAVGDFYFGNTVDALVVDYGYAAVAVGRVGAGVAAVGSAFNSISSALGFESPAVPSSTDTTSASSGLDATAFALIKATMGSSLSLKDFQELYGTSQGGAVALSAPGGGEVQGAQTEKPQEPLVPFPNGPGISPGFGGGGGTSPTATADASSSESVSDEPDVSPDPDPPPPPASVPIVPDGTPPSVVTLTINGTALATTAPFATTPVATTTTAWNAIVTFTEDNAVAPTVKDGTPSFDFTNGTDQTVNDCSDSDAKTFCFAYVPPPNIEAAVYWFFRIAGARDVSGEAMATTTYRFIVDTGGPLLTLDASATNQTLPTISGTSSYGPAAVALLVNAVQYSLTAVNGLWSFAVQAGNELAEGAYPIVATSTDQYNNTVVHHWTLMVDLTAPVLGITSGPAEGDSVASTSPVSFEFSAVDATALAYACATDGGGLSACVSPYAFSPAPGAHSFAVAATDAAGNTASAARNFTVLP